jgi:hypothetical protein
VYKTIIKTNLVTPEQNVLMLIIEHVVVLFVLLLINIRHNSLITAAAGLAGDYYTESIHSPRISKRNF